MHKFQNWVLATPNPEKVNNLAAALGVDPLVATLLVNRHIEGSAAAQQFLAEHWGGEFPSLDGCEAAVRLLHEVKAQNRLVVIYGDYDVDGICSTAIIYECLQHLGYRVSYRLPNRFVDGYGLTTKVVTQIAEQGAGLLLTVDCGVSAVDEVRVANELGLTTLITDHHQPGEKLPEAEVIINPRLNPQGEGRELCGAGVAFCLAMSLLQAEGDSTYGLRWLDLLALATVADIVPLSGYNRVWVKEGLQLMRSRLGLKKLLAAARVREGEVSAYQIGFVLAPRLNAAGRLETADPALELLLTTNEERAEKLAIWLDELNSGRQQLEEQIFQQALLSVQAHGDDLPEVLVLAGEEWHQGVIGIVASRVASRYQRPTVMVTWSEDSGKGSARSVPGFDILEALQQSASCLDHFGGHRGAAGLELSRSQFANFCQQINQIAAECYFEPNAVSTLQLDCEVPVSQLNLELGNLSQRLRPYGEGNPAPAFKTTVVFDRITRMGKNSEHFKGWLVGINQAEVICFREGSLAEEISCGTEYDLAFTPEINEFNGKRSLSMRMLDIRTHQSQAANDSVVAYLGLPDIIQPALVVCPDQRVLDLFWPFFRENYGEKAVALCGRAPNLDRGIEMLNQGESRIFLTTPVYFPYHIKKFGQPKRWLVWLPVGRKAYPEAFFNLLDECGLQPVSLVASPLLHDQMGQEVVYIHQSPPEVSAAKVVDETRVRKRADKLARRQSWIAEGGTLVTTGEVLTAEPLFTTRLVLAAPPFSRGEWWLLQQSFNPQQLKAGFHSVTLEDNQEHLRRFPTAALVADILNYLAAQILKQQTFQAESLTKEIAMALGINLSWPQLSAVLTVLEQTGVIKLSSQKDKISLQKLSNGGEVRLADSLLYLEGKWEWREWQSWKIELQQMAAMGGD